MGIMRLLPSGKYHVHVVARNAQQYFLLKRRKWKAFYLNLLQVYSKIYYFKVLGFVIMDNHVHLVLEAEDRPFDEQDVRRRFELAQDRLANSRPFAEEMAERYFKRFTSLSEFIKEIHWRMAIAYNKAEGKKGHFWEGRFKSFLIEDGLALLNVLTYVAMNPVRAGMVKDPTEFEFSSFAKLKKAVEENRHEEAPKIKIFEDLPENQNSNIPRLGTICRISDYGAGGPK